MNSSYPVGFHAMAIGFIHVQHVQRSGHPSDTEKSVSPSVVFAASRDRGDLSLRRHGSPTYVAISVV
jgi:hypothetical protein